MTTQNTAAATPFTLTIDIIQARHPELPREVAYDLLHFCYDAQRMGWVYDEDEEAAALLHDSTLPED